MLYLEGWASESSYFIGVVVEKLNTLFLIWRVPKWLMDDQMNRLRCPYCLEEFTYLVNPKKLRCGHICCLSCLKGHAKRLTVNGKRVVECPVCGWVIQCFAWHHMTLKNCCRWQCYVQRVVTPDSKVFVKVVIITIVKGNCLKCSWSYVRFVVRNSDF